MRETLYDKIGLNYNRTRKADRYIVNCLKHFLQPKAGECYLDIGCGTGNYTRALAGEDYEFYGVEPSLQMLEKARVYSTGKKINWLSGSAEKIPLQNDFFSGAIATLTIHHWQNLEKGFKELSRVCKNEGRLVIFTSFPEQMKGYWLSYYFPQMMANSIAQMPELETIEQSLENFGFKIRETEKYFAQPDLEDLFLYSGKQKPELYLDESIRSGISSFSALANRQEVENGLEKLREDIRKGKIKEIIEQFDNDSGDYVFVTAKLER